MSNGPEMMALRGNPGHGGGARGARSAVLSMRMKAGRLIPHLRVAFLGDPLWWAIGLAGLLADVGLQLAIPGALAGSVLIGAGQWLSCVLVQPVAEEIVFRGILQGELLRTRWGAKRIWRISAANALCSTVFAAMHFVHHPPLWALSVFVPSLIFGWLRERHGGLGAAIGMHVLYNLEFFSAASLVLP